MYGEGISKTGEILDLASKDGLVEKSGAWYSYDGERIGQGRENAKSYLKENPSIAEKIENNIRSQKQKETTKDDEINQDLPNKEIAVD